MNCANHPDVERAAFCQNCGKPLCRECMRTVGSAIYCEPCLEAKLSGAPSGYPPGSQASSGYAAATGSAWSRPSAIPPPPMGSSGGASPVLAGMLGFIPGVGAMYNGQFIKAIVHIVVFAVINSILVGSSNNAGFATLFGLMLAGWVFYQVFDAYHTARARRDGEPLPDPFGLNTLGDRIGLIGMPQSGPGTSAPYGGTGPAPASGFPPAGSATGFPAQPSPTSGPANGAPPSNPYDPNPYRAAAATPSASCTPPAYGPVSYDPAAVPPLSPQQPGHPLPISAIVLIALGIFFLMGSLEVLNTRWLGGGWPFLLIGLGVWILASRLHGIGGLRSDGSATYRWHLLRALCFPVWAIILTGVLALLDSWRVLSWDVGWAFYLIVWGILVLAMRTATTQMQQESFAAAQFQAQQQAAAPPSAASAEAPPEPAASAQGSGASDSHTPDFGGR
ncbi:MAG: B-box zinc finger protein [Acidobacteriaceae bacterium]